MQDAPYRVPVTHGDETLWAFVDAEDFEEVARFQWSISNGYARRGNYSLHHGSRNVYMHRVILGLERGDKRQADHINRDRLDNRRENLRIVTSAENNINLGSRGGSSRFRGVHWNKDRDAWHAQAQLHKHTTYLGLYAVEADAARAVNAFWVERGYPAPNEA